MSAADHTFVIPAFGNSGFLEDCILSLKRQTVTSKILITSPAPSSFLDDIAKKHDIGIRVNNNRNCIADDWNFAYDSCTTKYLTLAHQDDLYLPEYTERCLRKAESPVNKGALIIFTGYKEFDVDRPKNNSLILLVKKALLLAFLFKSSIGSKFLRRGILSFGNPICCPSVMFNTQNIGRFRFSDEYAYNLDWEAWLRLARTKGRFIFLNRQLMVHRLHAGSQTAEHIRNKNRYKEEERIFQSIWNRKAGKLIMSLYRYAAVFNKQGARK